MLTLIRVIRVKKIDPNPVTAWSVPETAAPQELTQEGCARKSDIRNIIKVTEETKQAVGFGIFRVALAYFA